MQLFIYTTVSVQVSKKKEYLWVMEELSEPTVIRWRFNCLLQGCCTIECTGYELCTRKAGYELCTRKVQHNQKSHLQMLIDHIRINKVAKYIVATRHIFVHEILYGNISAVIVMTIIICIHALIMWMQDGLQRCQVKYEPSYNVREPLHTKLSPQGVPSLTKPISGFPDESIVPLVALEVACQQRQCKVY